MNQREEYQEENPGHSSSKRNNSQKKKKCYKNTLTKLDFKNWYLGIIHKKKIKNKKRYTHDIFTIYSQ